MEIIKRMGQAFATKKMSYLMIFFAAIIYTVGIQSFLNVAGTFSAGLGAFSQLLTYTVDGLQKYFGFIYLAMNIPFLIFFWNKIKKRFLYKTIFFLLLQVSFSSLYLIPQVYDVMSGLLEMGGKAVKSAAWSIIIMALIGSFLVAFGMAIAWKYGGSTGGTDYIGYFYSTKRQKSVGVVLSIISSSIMTISFIINVSAQHEARIHWLATLVASVAYIAIVALIMNIIYPKYSKVRLEIHSSKVDEIVAEFRKNGFEHAYNIIEETSGFTGEKKFVISSVVLLLEVKKLVRRIYETDPGAWIAETRVRRVFGTFSTVKAEED